jgi:hypothetical protein
VNLGSPRGTGNNSPRGTAGTATPRGQGGNAGESNTAPQVGRLSIGGGMPARSLPLLQVRRIWCMIYECYGYYRGIDMSRLLMLIV